MPDLSIIGGGCCKS